jgi:dipeptidyl aminopeptidase/acylaminoacyl peptidase
VLFHPRTHRAEAVAFNHERERWTFLDPAMEAHFAALGAQVDGDWEVVSRDRDDRAWAAACTRDRSPTAFYLYRREERRAEFLFSTRPRLDACTLAGMRPVRFAARDGLEIHGYLTLPPEVPPRGLPAVLLVHGGPWARDSWGCDPEAQWLANRGYACLQVNYRGSTGYGKRFLNAANRDWGGAMQDDVTDGVRWLVEQGTADPRRVGIFGGSYGGYAVLRGMTATPELYACGVDVVGPSNLVSFLESIPPYWEPMRALLDRHVGHPGKDAEALRARSPLHQVDRIRAPLLIAQGANDPRVKRDESLQIVDALRAAGKVVRYLEFPDEGHGFVRPQNRLRFYAEAERFLAEHLGGRVEP